jgi:1-acyl-sn-glycerol-3-phosphate acyltransferase
MDNRQKPGKENGMAEWEYAPPPTPYDLVRDSPLSKAGRLVVQFVLRRLIQSYNGLKIVNRENVLRNAPCIIAPNHSSHLDSLAIIACLPTSSTNRTFALAAKNYFFRNSFISFWARLAVNVIPIDRTGIEKRGLLLALQKLKLGNSLLVFPEGTRSTSFEMGEFKPGVIVLSRLSQKPIIPTLIQGTAQSLSKGKKLPRRVRINVTFGDSVKYWDSPLSSLTDTEAAQDLARRVRSIKEITT